MKPFIPDTDKTITLSSRFDFREPGQPSPYRDRKAERQARKNGINESLRNALNEQFRQGFDRMMNSPQNLSGNPHVYGQAAQQLPGQWASLLGLRP